MFALFVTTINSNYLVKLYPGLIYTSVLSNAANQCVFVVNAPYVNEP